MNMIRYEPWNVMNRWQRSLDPLFSDRYAGTSQESAAVADWIPAVDIKEDEERFLLRADLPGVNSDDVEVAMEKGVLSIQGTRDSEKSAERSGYRSIERTGGRFLRRFTLPDTTDETGISAHSKNGVLEVVIPKRPRELAKKIKVTAA